MNVKRAFQVLGRRLGSAMKFVSECSDITEISKDTMKESSDFVLTMDKVIDMCNSFRMDSKKEWKRPICKAENENERQNQQVISQLLKFVDECAHWYIIPQKRRSKKAKNKKESTQEAKVLLTKPPCFHALTLTIKSLVHLFLDISEDFEDFKLATGNCNQDSVEHFFSKMRQRGGNNPNPTCRECRLIIRHMLATGHIEGATSGNTSPQGRNYHNSASNKDKDTAMEDLNMAGKKTIIEEEKAQVRRELEKEKEVEEVSEHNLMEFCEDYDWDAPCSFDSENPKEQIEETEEKQPDPKKCARCYQEPHRSKMDCPMKDIVFIQDEDFIPDPAFLECPRLSKDEVEMDPQTYLKVNTATLYARNSVAYFMGYIIKRIKESKDFCICCKEKMLRGENAPNSEEVGLINALELNDKGSNKKTVERLTRPSSMFIDLMHVALLFFEDKWETVWHFDQPLSKLTKLAMEDEQMQTTWLKVNKDCFSSRVETLRWIFRTKMNDRCKKNNAAAIKKAAEERKEKASRAEAKARKQADEEAKGQGKEQGRSKYDGYTQKLSKFTDV